MRSRAEASLVRPLSAVAPQTSKALNGRAKRTKTRHNGYKLEDMAILQLYHNGDSVGFLMLCPVWLPIVLPPRSSAENCFDSQHADTFPSLRQGDVIQT